MKFFVLDMALRGMILHRYGVVRIPFDVLTDGFGLGNSSVGSERYHCGMQMPRNHYNRGVCHGLLVMHWW